MIKSEEILSNADNSVRVIDSYILHSQSFVGEIKCFVKERADLEKQYSSKLKSLFGKYSKDNKKSIFGSARDSVVLSEDEDDLDLGSLRNSFASLG
jgi:hypothetical protein